MTPIAVVDLIKLMQKANRPYAASKQTMLLRISNTGCYQQSASACHCQGLRQGQRRHPPWRHLSGSCSGYSPTATETTKIWGRLSSRSVWSYESDGPLAALKQGLASHEQDFLREADGIFYLILPAISSMGQSLQREVFPNGQRRRRVQPQLYPLMKEIPQRTREDPDVRVGV